MYTEKRHQDNYNKNNVFDIDITKDLLHCFTFRFKHTISMHMQRYTIHCDDVHTRDTNTIAIRIMFFSLFPSVQNNREPRLDEVAYNLSN